MMRILSFLRRKGFMGDNNEPRSMRTMVRGCREEVHKGGKSVISKMERKRMKTVGRVRNGPWQRCKAGSEKIKNLRVMICQLGCP